MLSAPPMQLCSDAPADTFTSQWMVQWCNPGRPPLILEFGAHSDKAVSGLLRCSSLIKMPAAEAGPAVHHDGFEMDGDMHLVGGGQTPRGHAADTHYDFHRTAWHGNWRISRDGDGIKMTLYFRYCYPSDEPATPGTGNTRDQGNVVLCEHEFWANDGLWKSKDEKLWLVDSLEGTVKWMESQTRPETLDSPAILES